MSTRSALLFLAAFALVQSTACGSSSSTATSVTSPASTRCQATVSNSATGFDAAGGTGTLAITVARECAWRATTPASWVTFTSAVEGQGDGTVSYRIGENPDPTTRQASISVAEQQVAVSQGAAPCRYSISGPAAPFEGEGGEGTVQVETHQVCSWTAHSVTSGASVSPSSGSGTATIRVVVSANTGAERTVIVSVAGQQVTMAQRASTGQPPANPEPPTNPPPPPPPTDPPPPPTNPPPPPTNPPPPPTDPPPPPTNPPPPPTGPPPPPPDPPPPPPTEQPITLKGMVLGLSGSCPGLTFILDGRTVFLTSTTTFNKKSCNSMRDGDLVEVTGTLLTNGHVRAESLKFD